MCTWSIFFVTLKCFFSNYYQNVFQDADVENEEEGGDSIEVGNDEMILEDDPNDDGIAEAIAEAAQKQKWNV